MQSYTALVPSTSSPACKNINSSPICRGRAQKPSPQVSLRHCLWALTALDLAFSTEQAETGACRWIMDRYLFRAPVSGHHIKSVDKKRSQIAAEMSYDTRADSQIQLPLAITACQHDTHTHTHTHSHKANWQRLSTNEEHVPQTHEWLIFSEWQDKTPLDMKSRGFMQHTETFLRWLCERI